MDTEAPRKHWSLYVAVCDINLGEQTNFEAVELLLTEREISPRKKKKTKKKRKKLMQTARNGIQNTWAMR